MSIVMHKGDLWQASRVEGKLVLAHGVNCAGAMGAGIAKIFKAKYPDLYEKYHLSCKAGRITPGMVWVWEKSNDELFLNKQGRFEERASNVLVYNLAIKAHWKLPATYNALEASLKEMVASMEAAGHKEVNMPWIGCGLGGLDKNYVKKMMEEILEDKDIVFHIYEP